MKVLNSSLPQSSVLISCVEPFNPYVHIPTIWATDSERCGPINRKLARNILQDWREMANLCEAQSGNCGDDQAIAWQIGERPEAAGYRAVRLRRVRI